MAFFRFLSLLREVRDLIYAECADSVHMEFTRHRFRQPTAVNLTRWTLNVKEIAESFTEDTSTNSKPAQQPAALLSTSSQLRMEMLESMAANKALYVAEDPLMVHPARTLKKKIPAILCQQLKAINLKLLAAGTGRIQLGDPFAEYYLSAEWLFVAFPALQHVTVNHTRKRCVRIRKRPTEAQVVSHATFVKFRLRHYQSGIKDLFDYYQSIGVDS